jgi:hypothetical protein
VPQRKTQPVTSGSEISDDDPDIEHGHNMNPGDEKRVRRYGTMCFPKNQH